MYGFDTHAFVHILCYNVQHGVRKLGVPRFYCPQTLLSVFRLLLCAVCWGEKTKRSERVNLYAEALESDEQTWGIATSSSSAKSTLDFPRRKI